MLIWMDSSSMRTRSRACSDTPVEHTYRRTFQTLGIPRRAGDTRFARLLASLAYRPDRYPDLPLEMRDFIRAVITTEEAAAS
ncbi:hypothetical protein [Streptomyces sp. CA-132043]|uniref:hypothetical protein n=1 Tax=Streptomyces sp. CA-132043 TaxID=3240048 RepID=UPI003D8A4E3D